MGLVVILGALGRRRRLCVRFEGDFLPYMVGLRGKLRSAGQGRRLQIAGRFFPAITPRLKGSLFGDFIKYVFAQPRGLEAFAGTKKVKRLTWEIECIC